MAKNPLAPTRNELLDMIQSEAVKRLRAEADAMADEFRAASLKLGQRQDELRQAQQAALAKANKTVLRKLKELTGVEPQLRFDHTRDGRLIGRVSLDSFQLVADTTASVAKAEEAAQAAKRIADTLQQQMNAKSKAAQDAQYEGFRKQVIRDNLSEEAEGLLEKLVEIGRASAIHTAKAFVKAQLVHRGEPCYLNGEAAMPALAEVEVVDE